MVPGFDPVVTILVPQWHDSEDIFQFSQAYLLYFRLQAKLQYHYTNRVRSSTFLCAIQQSNYADAVTTLQSHINSYREEYDTGFLPAHLHIHGLAESIHLNAQNRLRDIASPRLRCIDTYRTIIQGIPPPSPHLPLIYCLGRPNRTDSYCNNARGSRIGERHSNGGYSSGAHDHL